MDLDRCPTCGLLTIPGGPCPHCSPPPRRQAETAGSSPARDTTPTSKDFRTARVGMIALIVPIGIFWIVVAALQFRGGWAARPGGEGLFWSVIGLCNLLVGGYTLSGIRTVICRRYNGQGQLALICVGGTAWALFTTMWLGGWFQLLVIPFQIGLGIVAWSSSAYFGSGRAREKLADRFLARIRKTPAATPVGLPPPPPPPPWERPLATEQDDSTPTSRAG